MRASRPVVAPQRGEGSPVQDSRRCRLISVLTGGNMLKLTPTLMASISALHFGPRVCAFRGPSIPGPALLQPYHRTGVRSPDKTAE